jgi:hypothetical protein
MSASVLKVILKGDDWTFTKKYLMYENYALDEEDEHVKPCLEDAKNCLKIFATDAEIKGGKLIR